MKAWAFWLICSIHNIEFDSDVICEKLVLCFLVTGLRDFKFVFICYLQGLCIRLSFWFRITFCMWVSKNIFGTIPMLSTLCEPSIEVPFFFKKRMKFKILNKFYLIIKILLALYDSTFQLSRPVIGIERHPTLLLIRSLVVN